MNKQIEALKQAQAVLRALSFKDSAIMAALETIHCTLEPVAEVPVESEQSADGPCKEADGCPTELAVLQRFWRQHFQAQATQQPVAWMNPLNGVVIDAKKKQQIGDGDGYPKFSVPLGPIHPAPLADRAVPTIFDDQKPRILGNLTHSRACPAITPNNEDACTCGLKWRIQVQTEQNLRDAWMKRAMEAEQGLQAGDQGRNALSGLPEGALDGGWTYAGMNAYTKSLEEKIAAMLASPPPPAAPTGEMDEFERGWRVCAEWASRPDLIADIGSPAYLKDRAAQRAKEGEKEARINWLDRSGEEQP